MVVPLGPLLYNLLTRNWDLYTRGPEGATVIEVVQSLPMDSIMFLLELLASIPLYGQYLPQITKRKGFYKEG